MKLTWKDGLMAVLMGVATAVMLAVTQGWGWPLLGSYRTGTLALFAVGLGMCVGGSRIATTSNKSAYVTTMSTLGGAAGLLTIVGLITAWAPVFVALWAVILVMWATTTVRHAFKPSEVVAVPAHEEPKAPALTGS